MQKQKKCEKDNFFVKESSFRFLAELFVCILDYITTITMYTCMQCTFVDNKMITIIVQSSAVGTKHRTAIIPFSDESDKYLLKAEKVRKSIKNRN